MADPDEAFDPENPPRAPSEGDDEENEDYVDEEESLSEEEEDPPYRMSPMEAAIANYKAKTRFFHYLPGLNTKIFYDGSVNPFLPMNPRPKSDWSQVFKDIEVDVTPSLRVWMQNQENPANRPIFEVDFFMEPDDGKPPAKRKRESEEETLSLPKSVDDGRPLGIEYYPNMWECLGRPDPKKIRTQYLLYETDAAKKACDRYREQINEGNLHFHVREAARIMCKRYDTLLSLCLSELHNRRQRGIEIPELPVPVVDVDSDVSDDESVQEEEV